MNQKIQKWSQIIPYITSINVHCISFLGKKFNPNVFSRQGCLISKVIGMPDFRGSAKGGVKKMELWKLIISKNFCYKAFLNTFIILKFFTAPENDAVWVLDFLKPYLLKLHFSPLNPNLMAGNAFSIFLNSYRNNIKNLASFNKKFM